MGSQNIAVILFISVATVLFCFAIAFDVSPFLRGPAPYPPDWRWDYLYINTFVKIWLPLLSIGALIILATKTQALSDKQIIRYEKPILILISLVFFLFQLTVVYFSRAGIGVLIHRIINPDLNGYFTGATQIETIGIFLATFNENVLKLPMHAQGHPAGAILFFWTIERIIEPFASHLVFLQSIEINHVDVALIWNGLTVVQKASAIISPFLIVFLSSTSPILIYFIAKKLYDVKSAVRAALLYCVIPSVLLFTPINDIFLPLFVLLSFLFFITGIKRCSNSYLFLSGVIFSLGLFFSLSLLPLIVVFGFYFILQKSTLSSLIKLGASFIAGLCALPLFLQLFFDYNTLLVSQTLMSGLPQMRSYQTWVVYNLYDFFIFSGIPVSFLFIFLCVQVVKSIWRKQYKKVDLFSIGFIIMLILLNFSGAIRGEVARIWLPFYAFLVMSISYFITKKLKLSKNMFLIVLVLQCVQILIMQEFWVMLW